VEVLLSREGSIGIGWPVKIVTSAVCREAFDLAITIKPGGGKEAIITGADVNKPILWHMNADENQSYVDIPAEDGTYAVAISADGQYVAIADGIENIFLLTGADKKPFASVPGGERTLSLLFDASRQRLISACSFQGGATVTFYRIVGTSVHLEHTISRSNVYSPKEDFVDTIMSLALSLDGQHLGIFETSAVYQTFHAPGWCGNVVLYDLKKDRVAWTIPIDVHLTADERAMQRFPMGFRTNVLFTTSGEIACGSPGGDILILDAETGSLLRRMSVFAGRALVSFAANDRTQEFVCIDEDGAVRAVRY
jgi:hypothetical protein